MKIRKHLKVSEINLSVVEKKELNKLLGGGSCCICGCQGPSPTLDNLHANHNQGLSSPGGGIGAGAFA